MAFKSPGVNHLRVSRQKLASETRAQAGESRLSSDSSNNPFIFSKPFVWSCRRFNASRPGRGTPLKGGCSQDWLFECISMKFTGSPEGYNAETGFREPAQKPQTGEPIHEHQSLYRIRRSQEKHQLLRQGCRRKNRRGRQGAGDARLASGVGREALRGVAWRDGGNTVQRVDLRCAETVCRRVADGEPVDDESHRRGEEEKRQAGCAHHRRSAALQSVAGLLCSTAGDAGFTPVAALPEPGGRAGGEDEEPDERDAAGSRRGIQQTALARQAVFQRVAGPVGGSSRIGEGPAAVEPGSVGDVRGHAAADSGSAAKRAAI